ncbi:DUF4181 domain-containing protein [Sporosarcina sp. SG10008]|uniref:DUF4181 domain-containing protein n=1 Tax=Sporosarcina sp. SG10008 TaxID=3373103 RepID=UPI0037DC7D88
MFWIKFAFIVLIVFVINIIVKLLLRKLLKIEKEKKSFFSYNHINELHRKIDWAIRITSTIVLIVTNTLVIIEGYSINLIIIAMIFYFVLDYTVRALFECKYSQNPKQYILTMSEGFIFLLSIVIVIYFDLLIKLP